MKDEETRNQLRHGLDKQVAAGVLTSKEADKLVTDEMLAVKQFGEIGKLLDIVDEEK